MLVLEITDKSFRDGRADGAREEVERLDEGFHGWRGFGVGVFETGDYELVSKDGLPNVILG